MGYKEWRNGVTAKRRNGLKEKGKSKKDKGVKFKEYGYK